jgi:hypothetical protein
LENKRAEQPSWKNGGVEDWEKGGGLQGVGGEVAQTMYTHMNKCKNNFKKLTQKKIKDAILGLETMLQVRLRTTT